LIARALRSRWSLWGALALASAVAHGAPAQPTEAVDLTEPVDLAEPVDEAPRMADPAARLPAGGSASEHWEWTVRLDSGHWIVGRLVVTNFGPGERNAVVLGHVITPGGRSVLFKNGRLEDYWKLSEDRRSLDVGSSHLSLGAAETRLRIDKDRARIDLRFEPQALPQPPADALPSGIGLEVLALAAPVHGTLQLESMPEPLAVRGHASLVHTWMTAEEGERVHRRLDFHALGDPALYILDWTEPGGRRSNWLLARIGEGEPIAFSGFEARLEGELPDIERPGYWVPAGIEWSGACVEGFAALSRTLRENDPLVFLPQPLRWLVGLRVRPHRVWATSGFGVTLRACSGRSPIELMGTGIAALTFMDPLTRP
jgi:hypothetical protein